MSEVIYILLERIKKSDWKPEIKAIAIKNVEDYIERCGNIDGLREKRSN